MTSILNIRKLLQQPQSQITSSLLFNHLQSLKDSTFNYVFSNIELAEFQRHLANSTLKYLAQLHHNANLLYLLSEQPVVSALQPFSTCSNHTNLLNNYKMPEGDPSSDDFGDNKTAPQFKKKVSFAETPIINRFNPNKPTKVLSPMTEEPSSDDYPFKKFGSDGKKSANTEKILSPDENFQQIPAITNKQQAKVSPDLNEKFVVPPKTDESKEPAANKPLIKPALKQTRKVEQLEEPVKTEKGKSKKPTILTVIKPALKQTRKVEQLAEPVKTEKVDQSIRKPALEKLLPPDQKKRQDKPTDTKRQEIKEDKNIILPMEEPNKNVGQMDIKSNKIQTIPLIQPIDLSYLVALESISGSEMVPPLNENSQPNKNVGQMDTKSNKIQTIPLIQPIDLSYLVGLESISDPEMVPPLNENFQPNKNVGQIDTKSNKIQTIPLIQPIDLSYMVESMSQSEMVPPLNENFQPNELPTYEELPIYEELPGGLKKIPIIEPIMLPTEGIEIEPLTEKIPIKEPRTVKNVSKGCIQQPTCPQPQKPCLQGFCSSPSSAKPTCSSNIQNCQSSPNCQTTQSSQMCIGGQCYVNEKNKEENLMCIQGGCTQNSPKMIRKEIEVEQVCKPCPSPKKINVEEGKFEHIKIYEYTLDCENIMLLEDMDIPKSIETGNILKIISADPSQEPSLYFIHPRPNGERGFSRLLMIDHKYVLPPEAFPYFQVKGSYYFASAMISYLEIPPNLHIRQCNPCCSKWYKSTLHDKIYIQLYPPSSDRINIFFNKRLLTYANVSIYIPSLKF